MEIQTQTDDIITKIDRKTYMREYFKRKRDTWNEYQSKHRQANPQIYGPRDKKVYQHKKENWLPREWKCPDCEYTATNAERYKHKRVCKNNINSSSQCILKTNELPKENEDLDGSWTLSGSDSNESSKIS